MELQKLRTDIDRIDGEILSLILQRRALMEDVLIYKKEHDMPVFDPAREREVLDRVGNALHDDDVFSGGLRLLYGVLMDLNKFYEYRRCPADDIKVPTDVGGASVRAVLADRPGALSRYLAPLAAAEINITSIRSQSMPGGNLLVDLELVGDVHHPNFIASLAVLADTAEKFTLV